MDNKKNNTIWGISLFIIGIAAIINFFSSIFGIELPDISVRLVGIITIVALPILVYSSLRILKRGKG